MASSPDHLHGSGDSCVSSARTPDREKAWASKRPSVDLHGRRGKIVNFFRIRRLPAVVIALLVTSAVAVPTPAHASERNGRCESGEFCYYYNSNNAGSVSDFSRPVRNYGTRQPTCYEFKGAGNGRGQCVKNNAASVWNRSQGVVRVYYNSNFSGPYQEFLPGTKGNLRPDLKNNNASHQYWGLPSDPPPTVTGAQNLVELSGGCERSGRRGDVSMFVDPETGFATSIRYRFSPAAGPSQILVWVVGRPKIGVATFGRYKGYENLVQDGNWHWIMPLRGEYPIGVHWYPAHRTNFNLSYSFDFLFDNRMTSNRCSVLLRR